MHGTLGAQHDPKQLRRAVLTDICFFFDLQQDRRCQNCVEDTAMAAVLNLRAQEQKKVHE